MGKRGVNRVTMASDREQITDEFVNELERKIKSSTPDHKSGYLAGVLATVGSRYFELAIDDLLSDVTSGQIRKKLNGRITTDDIVERHLPSICQNCAENFERNLRIQNENFFKLQRRKFAEQYDIVIQRRHQFMHGRNTQATFPN